MSKKKKQENIEKPYRKKLIKKRKPNRSIWGDIFLYLFLAFVALVMAFPIIYAVSSALKPLDELFKFPPTILAKNPTMDNFSDLFVTMGKSWVSFSRYLFNTVFITFVGTFGHLIVASMGAFVLAKYDFPGGKGFFKLVTVAMMLCNTDSKLSDSEQTGLDRYLLVHYYSGFCSSDRSVFDETVYGRIADLPD